MSMEEELLAIRLELKGVATTVGGLKEVDESQEKVGKSTRRAGDEAEIAEAKTLGLGNAYGKLRSHAKLALGFIGVGGAFALEKAVSDTEELAKGTSSLTRNFGFQTNVASRWASVMFSRDVDPKALSMAFGTLSSKITEAARKGGTLLTPWHQLGISQEELVEHGKDYEWVIMRVAKALGEEEGGAKRATAAKALLGKGFQTLTPLFSEGAKGLKEQLHWADEYGTTLSGSTTDGIMDMVKSQRELKIATLGMEVSMTKVAKPAIEAAEDQFKEFAATMADTDLSPEQKIAKVEQQFHDLEVDLIHTAEQMLPVVAEHFGEMGEMAVGALWHGFHESSLTGKAVIGAYIFNLFGGGAVIKSQAKRAGALIGGEFGFGIAGGALGLLIGYELMSKLSKNEKLEIKYEAEKMGSEFANYFIRRINESLNEANPLGNLPFGLSVSAPQIPEVEGPNKPVLEIPGGSPEIVKGHPHGHPRGGKGGTPKEVREAERALEAIEAERHRPTQARRMPELLRRGGGSMGGSGGAGFGRPIHVHVHVGQHEIAEAVVGAAETEAARR